MRLQQGVPQPSLHLPRLYRLQAQVGGLGQDAERGSENGKLLLP
jgi:hypothetical protein